MVMNDEFDVVSRLSWPALKYYLIVYPKGSKQTTKRTSCKMVEFLPRFELGAFQLRSMSANH